MYWNDKFAMLTGACTHISRIRQTSPNQTKNIDAFVIGVEFIIWIQSTIKIIGRYKLPCSEMLEFLCKLYIYSMIHPYHVFIILIRIETHNSYVLLFSFDWGENTYFEQKLNQTFVLIHQRKKWLELLTTNA